MKIYKSKNQKSIYCPSRQIFLRLTPEEKVRQELLKTLINDMEIPASSITTEYPLSNLDSKSKQRADVVVWEETKSGKEIPLIAFELKANHIEITDQTLEQVLSYNEILKAQYVGISNGIDTELFEVINNIPNPLVHDLYNYKELIEGKVEYAKHKKMKRLSYDLVAYDRYHKHLLDEGYISEATESVLYTFIAELQNYLLTGHINPENNSPVIIDEVKSYGHYSYGNASGGGYTGFYRSFFTKDLKKKDNLIRIGVFGVGSYSNNALYGSRLGGTYLNFAIDNSGTGSNILQLRIDKYFKLIEKDMYKIVHNGRQNGFKNTAVIEFVKKHNPNLIKNDEVYLGELPSNKSISESEGSRFIENLINYAYLRGELKKSKVVKKKKKLKKLKLSK